MSCSSQGEVSSGAFFSVESQSRDRTKLFDFVAESPCGTLPIVPHLTINSVSEHKAEWLVFDCDSGYTLEGSPSVYCGSNNMWSNFPTCTKSMQ